jgi:polyisoprenoid-binding protein YceI
MTSTFIGFISALAFLTGAASAETWDLALSESRLNFSYLENGATIEGAFTEFGGAAEFGGPNLEDARVSVVVDTASVAFDDPVRAYFARSVDWFDVEDHPAAAFTLTSLTPRPDGNLSAVGVLEMRGIRREVSATLTLHRAKDALSAIGELSFPRTAFGVGSGFSSLLADIGDQIKVSFKFVGQRVD